MDEAELSGMDWLGGAVVEDVPRARRLESEGGRRSVVGMAKREGELRARAEGARDGERDMVVIDKSGLYGHEATTRRSTRPGVYHFPLLARS